MAIKKHLIDVFGKVAGIENTRLSSLPIGEELVVQFTDTEGLHIVRQDEETVGIHMWKGTPDNIMPTCVHAADQEVDMAGHIEIVKYRESIDRQKK